MKYSTLSLDRLQQIYILQNLQVYQVWIVLHARGWCNCVPSREDVNDGCYGMMLIFTTQDFARENIKMIIQRSLAKLNGTEKSTRLNNAQIMNDIECQAELKRATPCPLAISLSLSLSLDPVSRQLSFLNAGQTLEVLRFVYSLRNCNYNCLSILWCQQYQC